MFILILYKLLHFHHHIDALKILIIFPEYNQHLGAPLTKPAKIPYILKCSRCYWLSLLLISFKTVACVYLHFEGSGKDRTKIYGNWPFPTKFLHQKIRWNYGIKKCNNENYKKTEYTHKTFEHFIKIGNIYKALILFSENPDGGVLDLKDEVSNFSKGNIREQFQSSKHLFGTIKSMKHIK